MNIKDIESILNHMGEQMTMTSIRKSLNKLGNRTVEHRRFIACMIILIGIFVSWVLYRVLP